MEQTGLFPDNPRLQPDILVSPPLCQPVVIETEYEPASTVEKDAIDRLGLTPQAAQVAIEQTIAVRMPVALGKSLHPVQEEISAATFEYCIFRGDRNSHERFPASGWLSGCIDDLVQCIEFALVSQRLIEESSEIFERGVNAATKVITDTVELGFPDIEGRFAQALNQSAGFQTNRMAMTIIGNAMTFHQSIAGNYGIRGIKEIQDSSGALFHSELIDTWRWIREEINYWPILQIASDLLLPIRVVSALHVLKALADTAIELASTGITSRHDLAGRMFQNLIIDRKFIATFYTRPTSAVLLAEIALQRMDFEWRDLKRYSTLRIADLSCGTGTLLSAAYQSVLRRYQAAGGDGKDVHSAMLEEAIVAADIMPAATHLCASQLLSVHPTVPFKNTQVYTMPYGSADENAPNRETAIGSLDLIDSDQRASLFETGQRQIQGEERHKEVAHIDLPHQSVDLVIMNPPFTRPTNHTVADVHVPSFAGFRTSAIEQKEMSNRLAKIRQNLAEPVGNGNAGLASNFIDLTHAKVKPNGIVALVLPIAALTGGSWHAARSLFSLRYEHITIITIAAATSRERAFSADTDMAETLIVATRKSYDDSRIESATYVNLLKRPSNLIEAMEVSKLVNQISTDADSGQIRLGNELVGAFIRAPMTQGGCAALRDVTLATTMMSIENSVLDIPRLASPVSLPLTTLSQIGDRGFVHRDIGNTNPGVPPHRGPFLIREGRGISSYPMLWGHEAARERYLLVATDAVGEVREGCEPRAVEIWQSASRLHFTLDFRLNAQSLAACLTEEKSLGGTAWPNFTLHNEAWEELIALWSNSTLGLMIFWWTGSRQHEGRSRQTISRLPDMPVIDPNLLSEHQWKLAHEKFQDLQSQPFLPANEAYRDESRKALDAFLLIELLGLPTDVLEALDNLRLRWCAEPSVHGNKSTAPNTES